ncbi:hypothetical protein BO71DRAFT_425783 [Aspergillus ellipticus CBS 707.79]|uniref:Uncharacterized protein n=1 Tax=Aspergillus ellipticus CBS 707.79 TaxID=1448320 RepID=A0A319DMY0_9EURO|nr:hypothetical protein BO71DRAFT_425783 [Aspergillus ellipticus CBS 707.79]
MGHGPFGTRRPASHVNRAWHGWSIRLYPESLRDIRGVLAWSRTRTAIQRTGYASRLLAGSLMNRRGLLERLGHKQRERPLGGEVDTRSQLEQRYRDSSAGLRGTAALGFQLETLDEALPCAVANNGRQWPTATRSAAQAIHESGVVLAWSWLG